MVFRRDPIARTGRNSEWHWSHFYKYPKTNQERRQTAAYPEFIRTRRRGNHLPHNLDDIPRGDARDHCWKRNNKRQKQWMR